MSVDERVARSVALEQAYVHDVYEQFYDNPRSRLWPKVQQFLQDLEPGSLVCDIGCGSGKYLNVNTSIYNMGGDKSMRLTELAREKENEVLVLDNLALPYRDESLDAVLSIAVVHHLATTERRICALRELARVLRIGGRIIISVWAMEQSHRKFESQDVLVPWRRPKHLSTPSLELTSTTNTSEDDCCMPPYHAYTQTSDSDSNRSLKLKNFGRKRGKTRHKSRSIDPCRNSSPSSSSLSSPNETCYSFVRRALQKLAGSGRRVSGIHRPWFLDGWSACTKEASRQPQHHQQHYNNCANCDCCECNENIQDLPIELRRIDDIDDALQQQRCRRQTFPSSQLINDITTNLKSKSMTNIKTAENCSNNHNNNNINKSNSNHSNNNDNNSNDNNNNNSNNNSNISSQSDNVKIVNEPTIEADHSKTIKLSKPKLVKQKKSICDDDDDDNTENNINNNNNNNKSNDNDDDDDEALDQPTDMKIIIRTLPDFNVLHGYNHNNNNTNHHNNINKRNNRGGVFKQHSLNEELMSTERLKEKERVRKNIQKQTSLNDDLIYQRNLNFDTFKETIFSVSSTSKRFQLIKTGFTNKIKNSTTNIEKVTSNSFKNGFVRMFQNWKSSELTTTTIEQQSNDSDNNDNNNIKRTVIIDDKKDSNINSNSNTSGNNSNNNERRPSKEDGSDSSKDSSLQSDTSVDSEDSFASVIFIPKSDPMSPTSLSPGPISPRIKNNNLTSTSSIPNSPRIKQSSCPTSPRIKQMPLTVYPLTKQLSSPKPSTNTDLIVSSTKTSSERDQFKESTTQQPPPPPPQQQQQKIKQTLAQKYSVPQIPKFKQTSLNTPKINSTTTTTSTSTTTTSTTTVVDNNDSNSPEKSPIEMSDTRNERLKKIKELLTQKPGFGVRTNNLTTNKTTHYPFVRHSSIATNGRIETIAKPLPKLLSLELFNPETDDKDSDSSCVSSPDSIDSVINVRTDDKRYESITTTKFKFPSPTTPTTKQMTLLEAAADVANTLDEAVDKVIKSSPQSKRNLQSQDVLTIMQRKYPSTDTIPLINNNKNGKNRDNSGLSWDTECHRHLTDFADKLSEKLLKEIDQYQEKNKSLLLSTTSSSSTSLNSIDNINDPYIYRLSEELDDLSKLSAEIQKQNEYLAKLSASDNLFMNKCRKCNKQIDNCSCPTSKTISNNNGNNDNSSNNNKSDSRSTNGNNSNEKSDKKLLVNQNNIEKSSTNESLNNLEKNDDCSSINGKLSISRNSIKMGTSTDSCDSERGSSTNSILSSIATSINFGQSMESTDGSSDKCSGDKDTNSISRYSDDGCGSTASLISCPEWKSIKTTTKLSMNDGDTTTNNIKNNNKDNKAIKKEPSSISLNSDPLLSTSTTTTSTTATTTSLKRRDKSILYSDTSQDSLPSDNTGGEITYHRYYHVFKEGELDQLIEKYVENLHIISSYYDHASWCIIAEKVQVWTI